MAKTTVEEEPDKTPEKEKSAIEIFARNSVSGLCQLLFALPALEKKRQFKIVIDSVKRKYKYTSRGFAKDVLLGTYDLLCRTYSSEFGEEFVHPFHARIQQDLRDQAVLRNYCRVDRAKTNGRN